MIAGKIVTMSLFIVICEYANASTLAVARSQEKFIHVI
jgi:hypothetical protein